MSEEVQSVQLNGKSYVVLPREEFDRLKLLAKAESLPELPAPDKRGTYPALEYARISLARKIILRRAELGLSQAELAELAGIRVETLCRIETGKVTPSIQTLERIERGYQRAKPVKSSRRHASTKRR
jgi:DNA-binding XRE family transcriptional regulator